VIQQAFGEGIMPHQSNGFPPFQWDTFASQLFWLALTFLLLYAVVAKIGLPRIKSILAEREAAVQADFAEAAQLKRASDAALVAYQGTLAQAHHQADAFLDETRQRLGAERKAAAEILHDVLDERFSEAERSLMAASAAGLANLRGIAGETAATIVAKLADVTPTGKDVAAAVARTLPG
jgi:F-type H+-transporting ATPase subunit b